MDCHFCKWQLEMVNHISTKSRSPTSVVSNLRVTSDFLSLTTVSSSTKNSSTSLLYFQGLHRGWFEARGVHVIQREEVKLYMLFCPNAVWETFSQLYMENDENMHGSHCTYTIYKRLSHHMSVYEYSFLTIHVGNHLEMCNAFLATPRRMRAVGNFLQ